ncbi:bifunctional DNA-formamidopyrimidine glycosylase/DNA-(apurinic or apyrimidinic site) lyase [Aggregicoccus sp. 17bor-14]|uniref:bifunctional DNA-formamidopyrimidine glycosylase/DNA-(apurinic or apyrimidinic site) lyase n=1 Tax=Myxococcaceae TaxID=31 RepID=UPI00129C6BA1|nr:MULTISPECIES: bifunctional DNA-formamidopyrimidine glycosylase/DNA-(apurinic or apyrimidinic site) lyase [Myxococcaceae]MBF5044583.1 bifunctional DNA-formamidopyrimidine glycosylase/DNA-(apurinic or apyrimidinic site) lyase [Simulacricoccus sp. 17bor-14]MRI90327.1 bifunctional DNA-formamidopyrimidine glycosylase/DNA-(apurinic or apyrimidinic site) lyase [Aggregicoccus sp. 17bor-14]
MPELPEVEFARRALLRWLEGRRVLSAEADATRVFRGAEPKRFTQLRGRLQSLERRGKYLLFTFEEGRGLLGHLGMTGKFVRRPEGHVEPYSRARFHLEGGDVVHFRDPRLFGRLEPAPAGTLLQLPAVAALGLDPLVDGLSAAQLKEALGTSKQDLKVALMDQGRIAGLGNIHAAEALFRAGLHPSRKPASLTGAEWTKLARAIQATLDYAFELNGEGDEMDYLEEPGAKNPFRIYGRAGEPCRKCRTPVESFTQGGRTTHFCPRCQPHPE